MNGAPYECLHVALLDSSGKWIDHTVTDSAGRFLLEAPRPGRYQVQFDVVGAEPIAGPLDTLKEGDFKQRAYSLAFTTLTRRDTSANAEYQERWRRDSIVSRQLREQESDSGWVSHKALPGPTGLLYPRSLSANGVEGFVVSLFIVDSAGRTRTASWHAVDATHVEFAKAVAASVPAWQWKPATKHGQPVCELSMDFTRFYVERGKPLATVQFAPRMEIYH